MKNVLLLLIMLMPVSLAFSADLNIDPTHIDVYITPYYSSSGPKIDVGRYSEGLMSADDKKFLRTIADMQAAWNSLSFAEMYVASIRLYDRGYRKAAVYWYYSAEYRGRLFSSLVDRTRMGGVGDPAYEILSSQTAFYRLVGPYINGYSFSDVDFITGVLRKVREEGKSLPDMAAIYPGVAFKDSASWEALNAVNGGGMGRLISMLKDQHAALMRQRIETGVEAKFGSLGSKDIP